MFSWLKSSKKQVGRTPKRRRTLRLEGLENRSLLAGVVDVSVLGGMLYLQGDGLSNGVSVVGTGIPGEFAVLGFDNVVGVGTGPDTSAPTLLRKGSEPLTDAILVTGVTSIYANLGNGNDQFVVKADPEPAPVGGPPRSAGNIRGRLLSNGGFIPVEYSTTLLNEYAANTFATPVAAPPAGSATALAGSITVLAGNGNDAVALLVTTPSVISVDTGSGNDYVVVESSSTANLAINTGATDTATQGSDRVRVRGTTITAALGVNTYGGNDFVDVISTTVPTIAINTGENGGTRPVDLAGNFDEVVRINVVTSQTVAINTNGGDDLVQVLNSPLLGSVAANTGDGDDAIQVIAVAIAQSLTLTSGAGADIIQIVAATVGGNAFIDTGFGEDLLQMVAVNVLYSLSVLLGDGNDTAQLTTVSAGYGYVYGQTGTDTFVDGGTTGIVFVQ
ncbi:hypothetical protein NA78x_005500 [Anatilimnocola sp. NA78]|uniref:hypothetical protein n=1 Tax=Anatilimnocola sp. NA78 TaxID=3415683 RepID=UPI003CE55F6E